MIEAGCGHTLMQFSRTNTCHATTVNVSSHSLMATQLESGVDLLLNFSAGMIIAFKSTRFDLTTEGALDGSPGNFRSIQQKPRYRPPHKDSKKTKQGFFFQLSCTNNSVDGWGEEQSVDLSPVDIEKWKRSGVTISVHDCSSRSKWRYLILLDQS